LTSKHSIRYVSTFLNQLVDLEFDKEKGLLKKTKEVTEMDAVKQAMEGFGLASSSTFQLGKSTSETEADAKQIKLTKLRFPG